jgi:hypothetical protein
LQCIAKVNCAIQLVELGFLVTLFNGHNWRERGKIIYLVLGTFGSGSSLHIRMVMDEFANDNDHHKKNSAACRSLHSL